MRLPFGTVRRKDNSIDTSSPGKGVDIHARTEADLAALRAVPGVEAVSVINSLPFGGRSWSSGIRLSLEEKVPRTSVAMYYGEAVGETLGAQLQEGR